eukprot:tig00020734_g13601.t1
MRPGAGTSLASTSDNESELPSPPRPWTSRSLAPDVDAAAADDSTFEDVSAHFDDVFTDVPSPAASASSRSFTPPPLAPEPGRLMYSQAFPEGANPNFPAFLSAYGQPPNPQQQPERGPCIPALTSAPGPAPVAACAAGATSSGQGRADPSAAEIFPAGPASFGLPMAMGPGGWPFHSYFLDVSSAAGHSQLQGQQQQPRRGQGDLQVHAAAAMLSGGRRPAAASISGSSKQPAHAYAASVAASQHLDLAAAGDREQEHAHTFVKLATSAEQLLPWPPHAQLLDHEQRRLPLEFRQQLAAQLHFQHQQLEQMQRQQAAAAAAHAYAHGRVHAAVKAEGRGYAEASSSSASPLLLELLRIRLEPVQHARRRRAPQPTAPPAGAGEEGAELEVDEGAEEEGRPSVGWTAEEPRKLLARMRRHFKVPSEEAVRAMGLSGTTMKRVCRRCGIKRWPFRKFDSLRRWAAVVRGLAHLQQTEQCPPITGFSEEHYLGLIEGRSQQIMEDPNTSIEDLVCYLRKELFKRALGTGVAGSDAPSSASKAAGRESQRRIAKVHTVASSRQLA